MPDGISIGAFRWLFPILSRMEPLMWGILSPLSWLLARYFQSRPYRNSVLHVSYMLHIPYYTVQLLRRHGLRADYLAIGRSPYWNRCDHNFMPSSVPCFRLVLEFLAFWRIAARYEVIHAYSMHTISATGWELRWLKAMNRRLVVHFRGCEARNRELNTLLHPNVNICQDCDHRPKICELPSSVTRRRLARRNGDVCLVSTPDLKDFWPHAIHFPLLAPEPGLEAAARDRTHFRSTDETFEIVHVTNQPGIEGTVEIQRAIQNLQAKGYRIAFRWVQKTSHEKVLQAMQYADLAIGRMKMGFYANPQIESLAMGIPTVTSIREDLLTDELRDSGFIVATLSTLQDTLEYYLSHPEALAEKRANARASILRLHNNDDLARRLVKLYWPEGDVARQTSSRGTADAG